MCTFRIIRDHIVHARNILGYTCRITRRQEDLGNPGENNPLGELRAYQEFCVFQILVFFQAFTDVNYQLWKIIEEVSIEKY